MEKQKNKQKGITLIALIVTIIVLIILAGVSINMLVGENGIINMAQRAKNETEQTAKDEQQALASAFERNYVTYNGQLHVEGTKLMNEYNEEIVMQGVSLGDQRSYTSYNDKSFEYLKSIRANIVRIPINPSLDDFDSEQNLQELDNLIKKCTELDMYVIIDFSFVNDVNLYLEKAINFFTEISEKYKDNNNILYEICNEPANSEWEEISNYANTIIPIIRENTNGIIIVGTPYGSTMPNKVIGNELAYENIMYTFHVYPAGSNGDKVYVNGILRNATTAIMNNIPIFITEMSSGTADASEVDALGASQIAEFVKKNNLNWIFYCFESTSHSFAFYDNDGNITESGEYAISLLNDSYEKYQYSEIDDRISGQIVNAQTTFYESAYKDNIINIIFSINKNDIDDSVIKWDVSDSGMGNIIAAIKINENDSSKYDLYIICDNSQLYYNGIGLFDRFKSLEFIDMSSIQLVLEGDARYTFRDDRELKEIVRYRKSKCFKCH